MEKKEERKVKVQVRNLTKYFSKLLVLDNISFDVYDGEFLCIVGPTGCGKTTFLNILSGLIPATSGEIYIDGEPASPYKHNISYVFQLPSCIPWRTVLDNIKFGLEIKGIPKDEMEKRVEKIVKLIGLKDFLNYYPKQLSTSMQQRVAIARAFVTDPDLLLMDEPYGQFDVKLRIYLEDELLRIWRELKKTVIFVTHNLEEAVYLAERILVLTQKPTRIKSEVIVDLPHPRKVTDPEFVKIRTQITELVKWW
jgi:sulfonate transport system ATP-binding protein